MKVDARFYMHEADQAGLKALRAVPGFSTLLKAYMAIWNERQFRVLNMSSNLRISERQLSKYHRMLPPICKKLGIDVPEMYLSLDREVNAHTFGDTKPFIVLNSGLLEALPEELIPTVIAHECGHIACHHVLYTNMGNLIFNSVVKKSESLLGENSLKEMITLPLQMAFYHWQRCSEFSADRAAAICDGSAEGVLAKCMYFAGYDKRYGQQADPQAFLEQALDYKQMIKDSVLDRTIEMIMLTEATHPFNVIRAYECVEWAKNQRFKKLVDYSNIPALATPGSIGTYMREIPMLESAKHYYGKDYNEVKQHFHDLGFSRISLRKNTGKGTLKNLGEVFNICVNGKDGFEAGEWLPIDASIVIEFYGEDTQAEIDAAHPGQSRTPNSSKYFLGKAYTEAITEFRNAGFTNMILDRQNKAKKNLLSKDGGIVQISISGQTQFEKGEWFDKKAAIKITYHTFTTQ